MLAPDFTWLVTKTTVGTIVTSLFAAVRAVEEVTATRLTAVAMIGLVDLTIDPLLAVVAWLLANMTTRQ